MAWTHRHMEGQDAAGSAADPPAFGERAGIGPLGLDIPPGRRFMGAFLSDESLQMHSPTLPEHLFAEDSARPPAADDTRPPHADDTRPPKTAADAAHSSGQSASAKVHGSYTLNPDFLRTQDAKTPPVPQLPGLFAGSLPAYPDTSAQLAQPITFPRPGDESQPDGNGAPAARGYASPEPYGRAGRQTGGSREPALYPKRNYSLPSALVPQQPKLQLDDYEFTSIESLERKWANVKTESTRMLSSAIYKYYFSQGEWTEFEQVFPGRVLEAWEDFRSKLSVSELGFINTVLVSQNPFSGGQGGQKHIPLLARTIPLAQVARTMVLPEDMRSRESYSSQGSNGAEVDAAFADWLIARFNAKKPGTSLSPSEPTFEEPRSKAKQQKTQDVTPQQHEAQKPAGHRPAEQESVMRKPADQRPIPAQPPAPRRAEQGPAAPRPAERKLAEPRPAGRQSTEQRPVERIVHEPVAQGFVSSRSSRTAMQVEKKRAQQEFPAHVLAEQPPPPPPPSHTSLGLPGTAPSRELRPKSAMTVMSTTADASAAPAVDEKPATPGPKTRRKFTFGSRSDLRQAAAAQEPAPTPTPAPTSTRRPSMTMAMPAIFQSWRKGSKAETPAGNDRAFNLPPPSPPAAKVERPATASSMTSSRARRHTHNFFSSRPVEVRPPTEAGRAVRRLTREVQMKDLPPLPPNAAEMGQLARLIEADVRVKATQSASVLRKQPGLLAHFSSHADLGQRMEGELDKPRSSSLTADAVDKGRRRPSVAAPSIVETVVGSSQPRDSVAGSSRPRESAAGNSRPRESGSTEITGTVFNWRPAPPSGDASWGFVISPLAFRKPVALKNANPTQLVVHSHTPTMNRRNLPAPEGTKSATTLARRGREARARANGNGAKPPTDDKEAKSQAGPAAGGEASGAPATNGDRPAEAPRAATGPALEPQAAEKPAAPELPKAKMPQDQAGTRPVLANGVRGVLYELAYLSTQGRNVWSKSEHIFMHMVETGLEVNRIAEQDFFDYCVDELLKASNDASHDLEAMGNKKMAKKLYESFNAKLSILLTGSAL
ncbi:hypothetical protein LPJ61_001788 [Coemansia biformis]|uniref:Uncharacterized protein n=1 Tax=Coemansia biformis TaxID=1286918 RepID=A0A9W7YH13_9FUNG|nr:hypothetical protein LPJ61_001788 [Coemansia biformis]